MDNSDTDPKTAKNDQLDAENHHPETKDHNISPEAQPEEASTPIQNPSRREALAEMASYGIITGLAVSVGIPVLGYAVSPALEKIAYVKTHIDVKGINPGELVQRKFNIRVKDSWRKEQVMTLKAWLYHSGSETAPAYRAYHPACTHLGCTYANDPSTSKFRCPCHGAVFNYDGDVVSGPPNRPLDRYYTAVDRSQPQKLVVLAQKLLAKDLEKEGGRLEELEHIVQAARFV